MMSYHHPLFLYSRMRNAISETVFHSLFALIFDVRGEIVRMTDFGGYRDINTPLEESPKIIE